jgi:hypothetical protein
MSLPDFSDRDPRPARVAVHGIIGDTTATTDGRRCKPLSGMVFASPSGLKWSLEYWLKHHHLVY